MLEKQVYELVARDLVQYSGWYFPMDDSVEDELTVRPFSEGMLLGDAQVIVRTVFTDCDGKEYVGYIYWSDPNTIEDLKPVLFVSDDDCITFWNGMVKPSWADYDVHLQEIKEKFPIMYRSEAIADLPTLSGTLNGLYFFGNDGIIQYI